MSTKVANIDSATPTESEPEMTPEERAEEERRRAIRDKRQKERDEKKGIREEHRKDLKERRFWSNERLRWTKWERDIKECAERRIQFKEYWDRRTADDKECWREKDFANAVDKMSRAGYHGKWGDFDVPKEDLIDMHGKFMQTTVGDVNCVRPSPEHEDARKKWDAWNACKGMNKDEARNEFISRSNRLITLYGWNPPPGWS